MLLTAPTGVTEFNINGMTLHSTLLLGCSKYSGFQPLSHDGLNTVRTKPNSLMLNELAPQSAQYTIKACDSIAGQTSHISLSDKRFETGDPHSTLKLAIGARVNVT